MHSRTPIGRSHLLAAFLAICAVSFFLPACKSGTTGQLRPLDPVAENTITNAIATGMKASQAALPFPYDKVAKGAGGAALALLAAWQALTHAKVKAIANGTTKIQPQPPV